MDNLLHGQAKLYIADNIPINKQCSGYIKLISTASDYRQGIAIYADLNVTINNINSKKMVLWEEYFDNTIELVLFKVAITAQQ